MAQINLHRLDFSASFYGRRDRIRPHSNYVVVDIAENCSLFIDAHQLRDAEEAFRYIGQQLAAAREDIEARQQSEELR